MLRKILFTGAVAALTSGAAMAAPAPYVGAGLGLTTITTFNNNQTFSSFRGMPFNVFAGYGGIVSQNFYLGGELNANLMAGVSVANKYSLKTSFGYGASVIPGVMLSDHTMAFARAGIVRSHFSRLGDTATGGQLGAGLQTTLTQNVDLRGEYDLTMYRTVKSQGFSTLPRGDSFNVSLVYKFD